MRETRQRLELAAILQLAQGNGNEAEGFFYYFWWGGDR